MKLVNGFILPVGHAYQHMMIYAAMLCVCVCVCVCVCAFDNGIGSHWSIMFNDIIYTQYWDIIDYVINTCSIAIHHLLNIWINVNNWTIRHIQYSFTMNMNICIVVIILNVCIIYAYALFSVYIENVIWYYFSRIQL